jgi:YbbR domain-containing protein
MLFSLLRWLVRNLSSLLLAFVLAVVVWVSAVTAANPNIEWERLVPIEMIGLDPDMLLIGNVPTQVRVTLRAPKTVADRISSSENSVRAWVDVSGLEAGTHDLGVQVHINEAFQPVRLIMRNPETVSLTLEPLVTLTLPVELRVDGEPAIGYQKGTPSRVPAFVTISGPRSVVNQVIAIQTRLDISDATETVERDVTVQAVNANGNVVNGLSISPTSVHIRQPISLLGGFRNVVVRVVTEGQVAAGYRLTNLSASPPNVVVFSTDPQLVADLPSFVETMPVDLTAANDDIDTFVALKLPEGISVVGNSVVLVQVNIAALEDSLRFSLPVNVIGLLPTYLAHYAPDTVDVIISGPVPVLNNLNASEVRVNADVKGLLPGTYQLNLTIDVLPDRLRVEMISPPSIEITIVEAPTATPTPELTATPTTTPSP